MERSSYTYSSKHSESNIKDFCHLSFCDSLTVTLTTLQAYCSAILNEFFFVIVVVMLLCPPILNTAMHTYVRTAKLNVCLPYFLKCV